MDKEFYSLSVELSAKNLGRSELHSIIDRGKDVCPEFSLPFKKAQNRTANPSTSTMHIPLKTLRLALKTTVFI